MNFIQYLLILRARSRVILTTFGVIVTTTLVLSLVLPKTYTATTTLVFNSKGIDPVTGMSLPALLMPGYIATQVDIITSQAVVFKVIDKLKFTENAQVKEDFQDDTDGVGDIHVWLAERLLKKLDVKPSRESSVLDINYGGADPNFAAAVANAFAEAYQQTSLQLKIEPSQKAAEFLNEQTKQLRANLEKAQTKISKYQQEKGLTGSVGTGGVGILDVENARLNDLSSQLVMVQSLAFDSASRQQSTHGNGEESPDVAANPVVQNLKIQVSQAESKLSELSQRVGQSHPNYMAMQAELEKLKSQLTEETRKATSSIGGTARINQQRESEIRAALAKQKARVLELNLSRDELSVLQRDVDNAQHAMDAVSQRFTQTSLESNGNQADVAVLNTAIPPNEPSRPRILLNTLLSIFLGAMLGVGFGLLAEMMDRRVRSREDISELLEVPVFAVIDGKPPAVAGARLGAIKRRLKRHLFQLTGGAR